MTVPNIRSKAMNRNNGKYDCLKPNNGPLPSQLMPTGPGCTANQHDVVLALTAETMFVRLSRDGPRSRRKSLQSGC